MLASSSASASPPPPVTPCRVSSSMSSSSSSSRNNATKHCRRVSFGSVEVREFNRIAGDHPDCTTGPPMSIDWTFVEKEPVTVDNYEGQQKDRRNGLYVMSSDIRREILRFGFLVSEEDIDAAEKAAMKAAKKREQTKRQQDVTRRTRRILSFFRSNSNGVNGGGSPNTNHGGLTKRRNL